ncbi:MAG: class I SAM-dependent methyltransferase [Phycisphaerae bacterium]|nr:class I SAM-dependent methyltransferase [Phycisphaerae bacterium]
MITVEEIVAGVYATGMADIYTCCICNETQSAPPETAEIRSNVRRFAHETFRLWRCSRCRSIHADGEVDLDAYYKYYPFFAQKLDWALKMGYRGLLWRLKRAGLTREHRILDYGCGSGLLVKFLVQRGYKATGYDPYSDDHGDPAALDGEYDFLIAQDVVEHAPEPLAILKTLDSLTSPGGTIVVGTPNAAGIDLTNVEKHVHPLHQPFHRHIFSIDALRRAGEDLGWSMGKVHYTPYTNMPLLSLPFMHHYMKSYDGTIDVLFDRSANMKIWLNPKTWFLLLFGYFLCDKADIVAIFSRKQ